MSRSPLTLTPLLPLTFLSLTCVTWSGCNDCDFTEVRCNGDVIEQCGHTDQFIGRSVMLTPCEGLNPRCVQADPDHAFCARSNQPGCATPTNRCDGDQNRIECKSGFEVATDCTKIQVSVPGQGWVAGQYVCTAPPGATADCRKPQ
jgi:hypothetical protein